MSHAPTDLLKRRHTAIRQTLAARGLDALIVTSLPNILYLTNFKGSSAVVLLTPERLQFITTPLQQAPVHRDNHNQGWSRNPLSRAGDDDRAA